MTTHRLTRRALLEGAAALGAIGCLPARSRRPARARRAAAGARRHRDPRRHRADHGRAARRFRARRRPHPRRRHRGGRRKPRHTGRRGDRRERHDLHARLRRYPLAPLDQHAAAVRALRHRRAERVPGLHPPRAAHDAAGRLCQRQARHSRSTERRRHHGAQLGAQHAQPRARRCRALRHARRRHPRPLRLRPGPGHAGRAADGPRRPCPYQGRVDAGRRHAHARHLLAQCRRRQHRRRRARLPLDRHGEEGLGRRPRARPADHPAHLGPEPHHGARAGRPARPRRAARASAADHAGGARDPQDARGQLLDRAGAGNRAARPISAWSSSASSWRPASR